MQSQVEAIKMKMNKSEEKIIDIEDKMLENKEAEKKRERRRLDHEGRLRELSNSTK